MDADVSVKNEVNVGGNADECNLSLLRLRNWSVLLRIKMCKNLLFFIKLNLCVEKYGMQSADIQTMKLGRFGRGLPRYF